MQTSSTQTMQVGFIGGGNMAEAIIKGLLASGACAADIMVAELVEQRRTYLENEYGISVSADAAEAVTRHQRIVLAVKPQVVDTALRPLAESFTAEHCLISILAGGSHHTN